MVVEENGDKKYIMDVRKQENTIILGVGAGLATAPPPPPPPPPPTVNPQPVHPSCLLSGSCSDMDPDPHGYPL